MNFNIRINRLSQILELLNKGYELSTPSLVERFGVTKKIIQTDFKGLELENLSDADKKNFRIDYGVKIKEVSNERLLPYKDELEGSIILDINGVKASDVETVSRATNNTNESKGTSVKLMTKNGQVMRIII